MKKNYFDYNEKILKILNKYDYANNKSLKNFNRIRKAILRLVRDDNSNTGNYMIMEALEKLQ